MPTFSVLFLIYACLLLVVFISLTYTVVKDLKMDRERIQNQKLQEYTKQLEQLYENISSFRHDYINILLTLEKGIYLEDMQAIKEAYEKVVKPTGEVVRGDQYSFAQLRNLQLYEVKSILAAKIIKAQAQQIDVKLEMEEEISTIYMDLIDFCRVLAILMDNAIEAAAESQQKYIVVAFVQQSLFQRVIIENSSKNQTVNLQSIFTKGYSSKGINRGLGLYNAQQMLDKNKYISLETSYDSGMFRQTLILKKNGG